MMVSHLVSHLVSTANVVVPQGNWQASNDVDILHTDDAGFAAGCVLFPPGSGILTTRTDSLLKLVWAPRDLGRVTTQHSSGARDVCGATYVWTDLCKIFVLIMSCFKAE